MTIAVSSPRAYAEIAAKARVGGGRREVVALPAEALLEPVAQQVEPGVVSAKIGQVGPRKVGCGVAWQL